MAILSYFLTFLFAIAPIIFSVVAIYGYIKAQKSIEIYTIILKKVMAHIENPHKDQPIDNEGTPIQSQTRSNIFLTLQQSITKLYKTLSGGSRVSSTPDINQDFRDYLTVIQNGVTESEQFITLKTRNFRMHQDVLKDIELCRNLVETLPYLGILGTVLGFLVSSFAADSTSALTLSGLTLALSSTAIALLCIVVIKVGWEYKVIPSFLEFESALQLIEDYARKYGRIVQKTTE